MSVAEQLAGNLTESAESAIPPEIQDKIRLHLFDTVGAMIAGLDLDETRRLDDITDLLSGAPSRQPNDTAGLLPLGPTVVRLCAATRATEVDDIHLAACVTPSSIIVPTALAAVRHMPHARQDRFLAACLAGYETMIRLGLAIEGPAILYKGIWPTYLCAGFGSAVATGVLLDLTRQQMAHGLAIAAAMAAGANARSESPTAKWFMAGAAAHNGMLAALAARQGFQGDLGLLGERWGKLFGITLDIAALTRSGGARYHLQDLAMKPWCAARQTMSALAAFQRLLADGTLKPAMLRQIVVDVPSAYLQMIDRPALPKSRQESFANLRYLFGLAAFAPAGLYDVARETLQQDAHFADLAGKIRIVHAPDLDAHYPERWPARVTITDDKGAVRRQEIIHAPGDSASPLSWPEVREKFQRVTGRPPETAVQIAAACQALSPSTGLGDLLTLIEREIFAPASIAAP